MERRTSEKIECGKHERKWVDESETRMEVSGFGLNVFIAMEQ